MDSELKAFQFRLSIKDANHTRPVKTSAYHQIQKQHSNQQKQKRGNLRMSYQRIWENLKTSIQTARNRFHSIEIFSVQLSSSDYIERYASNKELPPI